LEDRGRLKLDRLILTRDATSPFPGAFVVASVCSRQGFLTSGSNALLHGLPSLEETSDHSFGSYAMPVHSGGNRLGFSPNFPCRPLQGTCDGPTRFASWNSDYYYAKNL